MSGDIYKGMPKQVRLQAEASDQAMEDWKKQSEEAAIQKESDFSDGDGGENETAETPKAAEEAIPEGGDKEPSDGFDWKTEAEAMQEERDRAIAQFQTLKGKYDAELPRSQAEVRRLNEELDTLKAAPAATVADPATPAALPEGVDIVQLRADYGDSIVDAMIAMQGQQTTAAPAAPATDPELKARLDKIEADKNLAAEDAMYDAIEKEHSDWEATDKLATWHKFLAEVDPNTGETRQTAINRAHGRLDPNPIIRQLAAFKRRTKKGDTRLESQVVPGDDGGIAPAPTKDSNIYRKEVVDEFYKTQAQRVAAGKPVTEEHSRLDTLYTRAGYEGRIR